MPCRGGYMGVRTKVLRLSPAGPLSDAFENWYPVLSCDRKEVFCLPSFLSTEKQLV